MIPVSDLHIIACIINLPVYNSILFSYAMGKLCETYVCEKMGSILCTIFPLSYSPDT